MSAVLPCGHPEVCAVTGDEGTSYCAACAALPPVTAPERDDRVDVIRSGLQRWAQKEWHQDYPAVVAALDLLASDLTRLQQEKDEAIDRHSDFLLRDEKTWRERAEAAESQLAELQDKFNHLHTEWEYNHDRGDHLIYRSEWEAFDKWQREQK